MSWPDAGRRSRSKACEPGDCCVPEHLHRERVRDLVEANGGRVRFVGLQVSEPEQERRIGRPERTEFHKLTSVETLRRLRNHGAGVEQPPADLEIDTDRHSPYESAAAIARHFGLTAQDPAPRYPEAGD